MTTGKKDQNTQTPLEPKPDVITAPKVTQVTSDVPTKPKDEKDAKKAQHEEPKMPSRQNPNSQKKPDEDQDEDKKSSAMPVGLLLIGLIIGFLIGGPVGALIGAGILYGAGGALEKANNNHSHSSFKNEISPIKPKIEEPQNTQQKQQKVAEQQKIEEPKNTQENPKKQNIAEQQKIEDSKNTQENQDFDSSTIPLSNPNDTQTLNKFGNSLNIQWKNDDVKPVVEPSVNAEQNVVTPTFN